MYRPRVWNQANCLHALQVLATHLPRAGDLPRLLGVPQNTIRRWLGGTRVPQHHLITVFMMARLTVDTLVIILSRLGINRTAQLH